MCHQLRCQIILYFFLQVLQGIGGFEAIYRIALTVYQEFGEIPLDIRSFFVMPVPSTKQQAHALCLQAFAEPLKVLL